jgi:hypothetical protein
MIYVAVGRAVPPSDETSLVLVSVVWAAVSMMSSMATDNVFRRSILRGESSSRGAEPRER